jgi:hypothetical protein
MYVKDYFKSLNIWLVKQVKGTARITLAAFRRIVRTSKRIADSEINNMLKEIADKKAR